MKIPIQEIVLWILLPTMNFIIWFYLSHTGTLSIHSCPDQTEQQLRRTSPQSLEQLLDMSLKQLAEESGGGSASTQKDPCPVAGSKEEEKEETDDDSVSNGSCNLRVPVGAASEYGIEFQDTMEFEKFRAEKLASMTQDILLKTYAGTDTAILHRKKDTECQTIDLHMADRQPDTCLAVVFSPTLTTTNNLARIDQDIDIYGLSISNPDPSQVDKYSTKFTLNKHNEGKLWPQGFFRKVPKERGRERTKDKLGTFLKNFDEINTDFEAKVASHGIKAGDDLVAMVVNEGELDLFLNFACSSQLHNISLNNVLAFAGSRYEVTKL